MLRLAGATSSIEEVIAVAARRRDHRRQHRLLDRPRTGGRRLLDRVGPFRRWSARALPRGRSGYSRTGPKTIFIARFVAVLRVTVAWLAGIVPHALVDVLPCGTRPAASAGRWLVGLIAYFFGHAAANTMGATG